MWLDLILALGLAASSASASNALAQAPPMQTFIYLPPATDIDTTVPRPTVPLPQEIDIVHQPSFAPDGALEGHPASRFRLANPAKRVSCEAGWWPRSDLNRYVPFGTTDFKSGASTNSATGPGLS